MIDLPGKVLQQTGSFLATGFRGGFLKGLQNPGSFFLSFCCQAPNQFEKQKEPSRRLGGNYISGRNGCFQK